MNLKLIAMDLDGTALQNDHCTFSPRLTQALNEAHRRGIAIVPVTGRQFHMLPPALQEEPVWQNLAVLCNGAQIRCLPKGELCNRVDVTEDSLRQILKMARYYDLAVEFSVDGTLYLTHRDLQALQGRPELAFHRECVLVQHGVVVDSMDEFCTMPVEKVNLPYIPEPIRETVAQELRHMAVSAVWSRAGSMEITHCSATKAAGLSRVCQMLQIPMAQVMAMGDSGNDESMLRQAGFSVAMGNAPAAIQAMADAVTACNDRDGAAIAIERYLLHENINSAHER